MIIRIPRKMFIAVLLTILLVAIVCKLSLNSMWGVNLLSFISWWLVYWVFTVYLIQNLIWSERSENSLNIIITSTADFIWGKSQWRWALVSVIMMLIFYLLRVQTYLLGDGYTWLAELGRGDAYIHKWTEPGSIVLIRQLQFLLGGYTKETALSAFQLMSILFGGIYIFFVLGIIKRICLSNPLRLMMLIVVVFSGSLLLFFGYVEFYSLVWAASAMFIYFSIRYLQDNKGILLAILSFCIALLMHVQAIYFLPGLLFLFTVSIKSDKIKIGSYIILALSALASLAILFWLYRHLLEFEILILPFFTARPDTPGYTLFSLIHFRDIFNELILIIPSSLILLSLLKFSRIKKEWTPIGSFLLISAFGGVLFLFIFGGAITMARDWDIMSLSFFLPLLLLFYLLNKQRFEANSRIIGIVFLCSILITVPYFYTVINKEKSEQRFYSLLNNRNRNGWIIYANYFQQKGNSEKYNQLIDEMNTLFPEYQQLQNGYVFLESGYIDRALTVGEKLIEHNPYNPDFMQFLANVYKQQGKTELAETYYHKALSIKQYHAPLLNELAQLYMKTREYDKAESIAQKAHVLDPSKTFITETYALANIYLKDYNKADKLADTLFMADKNSPGAHLIKMTIALNKNDMASARTHYREYLKYGQNRSDYESIRNFYSYLN